MITVTAPLWLWSGAGGSWHFVTIPDEQADEIRAAAFEVRRGFGSVRVQASVEDPRAAQALIWRTSVFPQKAGGYLLPVKAEVRRRAAVAAGDTVTIRLELL